MNFNAVHVSDTRIASAAIGLGFVGELFITTHARSRKAHIEVQFKAPSVRFPDLDLSLTIQHWRANRMMQPFYLDKGITLPPEPLHAFACAMRAQRSYDAYLHAQSHFMIPQLVGCDGGWAFEYDLKIPANRFAQCETMTETDLALCAALGPMGIPMIAIHGGRGERVYTLARNGYALRCADGVLTSCDALHLTRRAPTPQDPLRLALEDEQPMHPVCIGYDSLTARAALKRQIELCGKDFMNLLVTANDGTSKQALVSLNFKGHVGDSVAAHFKAPPRSLGL